MWSLLTHWGFLDFMGAIGLFAMVAGLTLLVIDRPSARRQVALGLSLLAVFLTHIYRFPFAIAVVVGITLCMYPATRQVQGSRLVRWRWRWRCLWCMGLDSRPGDETAELGPISIHKERIAEVPDHLFGAFVGTEESAIATQMLWRLPPLRSRVRSCSSCKGATRIGAFVRSGGEPG